MVRNFVTGIVFASFFAVGIVGAQAKGAKAEKVDICHYSADENTWRVISVNGNAVDAHFANHGDAFPGEFYPDTDGDGYGDADGEFVVCPEEGYVDNADDCNDDDATIFPGTEEICDDGIDNNCDGEVDEDCAAECSEEVQAESTRYASNANDWMAILVTSYDANWHCQASGACEFGCTWNGGFGSAASNDCTYDEVTHQITCQSFCNCPDVSEYQQYQDATVEEEGEFDEEGEE